LKQPHAALATFIADVTVDLAFFLQLVEGRLQSASISNRLQFCAVNALVFIFKTS